MAQRRMFSKTITNSDSFLEMPDSSQNLYFHLSMNADDDGFVDNWKSIMRMTGHKEDDLKVLIAKQYIIPFDTGVIIIKHWRMNNYLRSDRYKETVYKEELKNLSLDENLVYQMDTNGIHRLGKDRLGKESIGNSKEKFTKPTIEEINSYCKERKNNVDPDRFYNFYESKGWYVGKNKMKDWKACVRTWEKNTSQDSKTPEWFNEEQVVKPLSKEEQEEMNSLLEEFKWTKMMFL